VTAASAENADSFELFKLVTTTENMTPDAEKQGFGGLKKPGSESGENKKGPIPVAKKAWGGSSSSSSSSSSGETSSNDGPADEPASSVPESAQFADLHNRLQAMMKHISALNRELSAQQKSTQTRYNTLEEKVSRLEQALNKLDTLAVIDRKLAEVQADVRQTKADLHNALDKQVTGLKNVVRDGHKTMLGSAPGVMSYILVGVAGQGITVLGYLVYKRRKNAGPKKYL
jgi:mannose-binding lectin 1